MGRYGGRRGRLEKWAGLWYGPGQEKNGVEEKLDEYGDLSAELSWANESAVGP